MKNETSYINTTKRNWLHKHHKYETGYLNTVKNGTSYINTAPNGTDYINTIKTELAI